jgi:hypothetical protein
MPFVFERIERLPPEWQTRLAAFDAQSDERKILMRRPRALFILTATPFAPLGLSLMAFGIYGLLTDRFTMASIELLLAVGFFAAAFVGFPGWRALYRRRHRERYYVYLGSQHFVERIDRRVTIIPRERLLHVHESVAVDDYFTCLDYRDGVGHLHSYVLKSWYETKNHLATDLVLPIRKVYGLRDSLWESREGEQSSDEE